jgi:hypothetical protein
VSKAATATRVAGAYRPARPQLAGPALGAARKAVAAGRAATDVDVLPLTEAVTASEAMESGSRSGRVVLSTGQ